jgi:hypothetical protein
MSIERSTEMVFIEEARRTNGRVLYAVTAYDYRGGGVGKRKEKGGNQFVTSGSQYICTRNEEAGEYIVESYTPRRLLRVYRLWSSWVRDMANEGFNQLGILD